MKLKNFKISLMAALLGGAPVAAHSAVPTLLLGTPYDTDKTSMYVVDQTSQILKALNNVMCHIDAVKADKLVNQNPYVALVNENICNPQSSGGGGGGGGAGGAAGGGGGGGGAAASSSAVNYSSAVVKASRVDNASPMVTDMWFNKSTLMAHVSATQAPSATQIYGAFRADYCGRTSSTATTCDASYGYVNADATGLMFFSADTNPMSPLAKGAVLRGMKAINSLSVNATTATSGSGGLNTAYSGQYAPLPTDTWTQVPQGKAIAFAYDANYFVRSDDAGVTQYCFDRKLANADITTWSYGLYDASLGTRFERLTGFPFDYTDAATNKAYTGYIGYYGMWSSSPTPIPNGATLNRTRYTATGAVKVPYSLLQTGGKLIKYSKSIKSLDAFNGMRFYYYSSVNVPTGCTTACVMNAGGQYELYWKSTAAGVGQFMVTSKLNTTSWVYETLATPVAVANADMVTNNSWGLWMSTSTGSFNISPAELGKLTAATPTVPNIIINTQDAVYPVEFGATGLNLGGLVCISDCPTGADITKASAAPVAPATTVTAWSPYGVTWSYPYNVTLGTTVTAPAIAANAASALNVPSANFYSIPSLGIAYSLRGTGVNPNATVTFSAGTVGTYTMTFSAGAIGAAGVTAGTQLLVGDGISGFGQYGPAVATSNLTSYTLNSTTGNLVDAAAQAVIVPSYTWYSGQVWWGQVYSGKMVAVNNNFRGDSKAELDAAKAAQNALVVGSSPAGMYRQSDIDLIGTYYVWQSSPYQWDQMAEVTDTTTNTVVKFEAPLMATYTVPANTLADAAGAMTRPYGVYAGASLGMTYNGFGDLWGVPYACVDLTTNSACNWATGWNQNWSWQPAFSIPFDSVNGVVSVDAKLVNPNGAGTLKYYVKPLESEARLSNIALSNCTTAKLATPNTTPPMPQAGGFVDPTTAMGAAPTPADLSPRVIQGDVKF